MTRLAFVGLGVMGYPMAGHLVRGGHDVIVYNRTASKAVRWVEEHGGESAPTPRQAVQECELALMCVGGDDDVRAVVYGPDGVLSGLGAGTVLVDHTTASAGIARELDEICRERNIGFIDAPVSGGQAGAVNGRLSIMCGGEEAVFARAKPVLDLYAKECALIGPVGSGQLAKMVNQIAIAGLLQGLAEAINFGRKAGLDIEKVVAVISQGAAQSWEMDNRWKAMDDLQFDGFGFAVDWMRKDLGICLEEAHKNGARLPATALIDQFYAQVQARGGGRWDTCSLIHLLAND